MRLASASLLALVLVGGAVPGSGRAAPAAKPTDSIRAANDRLRVLLAEQKKDPAAADRINKQINTELRDLLEIRFLVQRALVDHWEGMTAKQRTDVTTTLQSIVENNYLTQLRGNLEYQIDYVAEEAKGDDVLVKTFVRAQRHGRPSKISVDYLLHAENDHWRVIDVITEEVSILQNYRAQFNRIIAKEGVDGLVSRMKTRLEKDKPAKAETGDRPGSKAGLAEGATPKVDKPAAPKTGAAEGTAPKADKQEK